MWIPETAKLHDWFWTHAIIVGKDESKKGILLCSFFWKQFKLKQNSQFCNLDERQSWWETILFLNEYHNISGVFTFLRHISQKLAESIQTLSTCRTGSRFTRCFWFCATVPATIHGATARCDEWLLSFVTIPLQSFKLGNVLLATFSAEQFSFHLVSVCNH